jgi:hypothetical protein
MANLSLSSSLPASRVGYNFNTDNSTTTNALENALFLKVFSGEILTAFEDANIMKGLHTIRTISNGKSAQFPVTGIASAKYHTPGNSLIEGSGYLSDIQKSEKVILIDEMLTSSTFLANIDELKTHFDIRSVYAQELGKALAKRFDIATMKTLYHASKADANITGVTDGGSSVYVPSADLKTTSGIIDALFTMAQTLDEKNAPQEGRFAILHPSTYYQLITADTGGVVNSAVNTDVGGQGSLATGTIPMVAGISLFKSNHIVDVAGATNTKNSVDSTSRAVQPTLPSTNTGYDGDFRDLRHGAGTSSDPYVYGILGGTKEAIGTVKLLDLATESEYQIERQGTLFVAKYAMGHGVLRPECAVSIVPEETGNATDPIA